MDLRNVRKYQPWAIGLFQALLVNVYVIAQYEMPMYPEQSSLSFPPAMQMESQSPVDLSLVEAEIPTLPESMPKPNARQGDHITQAEGEATFAQDDEESVSISVPIPPVMHIRVPKLPPPQVCWHNPANPICPPCPPCICKPSCTPTFFSYCSQCHKECRCKFELEQSVATGPHPLPLPPIPFAVGMPPPGAPILAIPSYKPAYVVRKRRKHSRHKSRYASSESSCESDTDSNTDSDTGTDSDSDRDSDVDFTRRKVHHHNRERHSRHHHHHRD